MNGALVKGYGLMVFDVLKDVEILSADGVENLCLDFTVREIGVADIDLEARRPVLVDVSGDIEKTRLDVVVKIYLPGNKLLG
jgi:hypothetical protein